jgi:hypothetical protein
LMRMRKMILKGKTLMQESQYMMKLSMPNKFMLRQLRSTLRGWF